MINPPAAYLRRAEQSFDGAFAALRSRLGDVTTPAGKRALAEHLERSRIEQLAVWNERPRRAKERG